MQPIKHVGVVGAGTMGHGIAQVFARSGYLVVLADETLERAEAGISRIKDNLSRLVEKKTLAEVKREDTLQGLRPTGNLNDLAQSDLVVEAIVENLAAKEKLFRDLDRFCPPQTILASNTSSLPITRLAAVTSRPDRFIGMHFMNPVPVMKLVEVVRGHLTSSGVVSLVKEICVQLGKTPVEAHDFPGFISNRILMPMINEAAFAYMEGVGTREAIDTVMKLGMNHPMGPLELADFIGLDVCLAILEVLYEGFKDPKYRPCPLLSKMVQAGQLGRKTSQGFYSY